MDRAVISLRVSISARLIFFPNVGWGANCKRLGSEQQLQPELKLTARRRRRGQLAEARVADGERRARRAGQEEGRRVRQVEGLRPELEVEALPDLEISEDRG